MQLSSEHEHLLLQYRELGRLVHREEGGRRR